MTAAKPKIPAEDMLKGVLYVLDQQANRLTVELIQAVREMVQDALDVLQERDPLKKKIGFILLAIQQSTSVSVRIINGKRVTRVSVLDRVIYEWAMEEIHALAGAKV